MKEISKLLDESDIRYFAVPGVFDFSGDYTISIHKTEEIFQLQSKLFKDFTHLFGILEVIINHEAKGIRKILLDNTIYTKKIVAERSFPAYDKSLDEVKFKVCENWNQIKNLLKTVYTEEADEVIIPDTSYLLDNNDFTKWKSKSGKPLTIVIPTIVLQELDEKKEFHRNPNIQKVAQSIAKRIMSILARNPNSNVKTIIKSKVYLKLELVEPKKSNTLESLDFTVADDRFIASAFEIIRRITQDMYDKKAMELKDEQEALQQKKNRYFDASINYGKVVTDLVSITSRAWEIFESSKIDRKRQLLGMLTSNLEVDDKKLYVELKSPLSLIY